MKCLFPMVSAIERFPVICNHVRLLRPTFFVMTQIGSLVVEMRVVEMRVVEMRVVEMRVVEMRVVEMRVVEMRVGEMSLNQVPFPDPQYGTHTREFCTVVIRPSICSVCTILRSGSETKIPLDKASNLI